MKSTLKAAHDQRDDQPEKILLVASRCGGLPLVGALQRLLLLACIFGQSGCSVYQLAGRTLYGELHEYPPVTDAKQSCQQYQRWARKEWQQWRDAHPDQSVSSDYASGFLQGFVDQVYAGGPVTPPPIPPRRYWRIGYRNPRGETAVQDWFAGFRHGAEIAREKGYRERAVIPSSLLLGEYDSQAGHQAYDPFDIDAALPPEEPAEPLPAPPAAAEAEAEPEPAVEADAAPSAAQPTPPQPETPAPTEAEPEPPEQQPDDDLIFPDLLPEDIEPEEAALPGPLKTTDRRRSLPDRAEDALRIRSTRHDRTQARPASYTVDSVDAGEETTAPVLAQADGSLATDSGPFTASASASATAETDEASPAAASQSDRPAATEENGTADQDLPPPPPWRAFRESADHSAPVRGEEAAHEVTEFDPFAGTPFGPPQTVTDNSATPVLSPAEENDAWYPVNELEKVEAPASAEPDERNPQELRRTRSAESSQQASRHAHETTKDRSSRWRAR